MKRIIFYLMLLVTALTFILPGCKKETPPMGQSPSQISQRDKKVAQLLTAFKQQLTQKSGGSMSNDSSVWYVEGLLNMEQANNNHLLENINFFNDSLILYSQSGSITMDQLDEAYNYFTETITEIIAQQDNPDFKIDMVNIDLVETGLKDGSVEMVMTAGGGEDGINHYVPFGTDDYWYWGWNLGKCDVYQGQGVGEDAADKLQYKFNHPLWVTKGGYYTDVELVEVTGPDFSPDPTNPGPYCDYIIFYYWPTVPPPPPIPEPCLSPDELNFYLGKFDLIKDTMKPANKEFMRVEVYGTIYPNGSFNRLHVYDLYYGVLSANPG